MASYNADVRVDGTPMEHVNVSVPPSPRRSRLPSDKNDVSAIETEPQILYEERKWDHLDPYEYIYDKKDPGYVMIINQMNFMDETISTREGSDIDVEEIIKCFGRQGYNIGQQNVVIDSTKVELLAKVQEVCDNKLDDANSLIVFVMSHGEAENKFQVYDGTLDIEKLVSPFLRVESLKNKPKMFIFQTCKITKGEKYKRDYKLYVNTTLTSEPNVLMYYSTLEDDVSYRDERRGTWFIQELCRNIYSYGHREEILSILMRCNKCLAKNYYNNNIPGRNIKQTPLFISTLTRNFYVSRSKDRYFYINKMNKLRKIQDLSNNLIKNTKQK